MANTNNTTTTLHQAYNQGEKMTAQQFADECCSNYRNTLDGLVGYSINDIYEGFRKFGDECQVQSVAIALYYGLIAR